MNVYLDNAATSWPKPPGVIKAVTDYLENYGVSPGRSGYSLSVKAAREVFETREMIAEIFNQPDSERVVFTANATHAMNICLKGILKKGDHVITTSMEHNSVYRPLKALENRGLITVTIIPCDKNGGLDLLQLENSIKPETRIVVSLHGSNVNGAVMPISKIGEICRNNQLLFVVDVAQTAGLIAVDMVKDNIDVLAFSGHKSLYGPPGVGGLCIRNDLNIEPLFQGGTGSRSEMAEHPGFYPDRLEAGTLNTLGIIGLKAGLKYLSARKHEGIFLYQQQLTMFLISKLREMDHVDLYLPTFPENSLPVVSCNFKGISPSQAALILDRDFGIMTRAGLHCSPLAHKSMGTFPQGTVRISPGIFTTQEQIEYTLESIKKMISHKP